MSISRTFLVLVVTAGALVSCEKAPTQAELATKNFNHFVDSVNSSRMDYTNENWASIESEYRIRAQKAEEQLAKMDAQQKKDFEASKTKYKELSNQYQMELTKKFPVIDSKVILRNSLFGEGKVGDDMSFAFANAGNLLTTYQTFYDAMYANKDSYSREDWDEVKVLYEALDTRKNEVEDKLSGSDNRKIATLKIKISGVYDTNRPGSKVQENSDAKK